MSYVNTLAPAATPFTITTPTPLSTKSRSDITDSYTLYQQQQSTPSIALICQSNLNRSMEAHHLLQITHGYHNIYSYGIGTKIRLPGVLCTIHIYNLYNPYNRS